MTADFWLGIMTALWAVTVGGVTYAIWQFVWRPWQVMRRDMAGLKMQVEQALSMVARARVLTRDDAETARIEARQRARARAYTEEQP